MTVYTVPALDAVDFEISAAVPESVTNHVTTLTAYLAPALAAVAFALVPYTPPTFLSIDFELRDVAPTVTTNAIDPLQVGVPFSQQLVATGDEPITWTGTVPDGLSLSSSGLLSGTPTTAGPYSFTVTATNIAGSYNLLYTGTIEAAEAEVIVTDQPSGGWGAYNDSNAEKQRRKRKEYLDELDAEADRLEALLIEEGRLPKNPAVDDRIQVREYALQAEALSRRAQRAIAYALRARTDLAYQLAAREIAQQLEDEEYAVLLLLAAA